MRCSSSPRRAATLVGGLTLCNVRRGVTQSCTLGYWIGAPHAQKGYMTAAVRAVVPFVFDSLELHRLEAACLPANAASIKLLEKTGFKREGLARRYLRINGVWQDHLLYALLDTDTTPLAARSASGIEDGGGMAELSASSARGSGAFLAAAGRVWPCSLASVLAALCPLPRGVAHAIEAIVGRAQSGKDRHHRQGRAL